MRNWWIFIFWVKVYLSDLLKKSGNCFNNNCSETGEQAGEESDGCLAQQVEMGPVLHCVLPKGLAYYWVELPAHKISMKQNNIVN